MPQTLKTMENNLLEMKRQLLEEILEKIKNESDTLKTEIGDIYDTATTERDRELSLLLCDRDREKLKEIDDALKRIEEGTYGICEECGEKIALGRLKALPFTRLCVTCKTESEKIHGLKKEQEEEGFYKDIALITDEDEH